MFLLLLFFIAALSACDSSKDSDAVYLSGFTMGTTYNITIVSDFSDELKASLNKEVDDILVELNQQMSTYIDGSDILVFNQLAINTPKEIKQDFLDVILLSQEISQLSGGYFDITIGPLVELWGFGKNNEQKVPSPQEIVETKSRVGWESLLVDENLKTISKTKPIWLDVSAVAKGFAVDKIYQLIESKGYEHYLVEIGGEMRVKGLNRQQKKWRIGIEVPSLVLKQSQQLVQFSNASIATSGDYRNFFEEDGQRYSHTLDPQTGRPVKNKIASVSVIGETAAKADAMATALNVLGEERALALSEREGLAAYFILHDTTNLEEGGSYRIVYTDSFKQYIQ